MPIQKVEVSIATTSSVRQWNAGSPISPPKITMNGNPFPAPKGPAYTPVGWQLVVLDAHKDMTKPEAVVCNEYILITATPSWSGVYQRMYSEMVRKILLAGDVNAQIVFAASYGLDANMPPTNEGIQTLFELGSGPKLQDWEKASIPGKQSDTPGAYVDHPANYVLIGYSSYRYGQGYEAHDRSQGPDAVTTTLTATLNNIVPTTGDS